MVVKILNVQDEEEEDRMGSVLLLCYGNRAAIAGHRPPIYALEKYLFSSDDDIVDRPTQLICISDIKDIAGQSADDDSGADHCVAVCFGEH